MVAKYHPSNEPYTVTMVRVHGERQYHCEGVATWLVEPDTEVNKVLLEDFYKS